MSGRLSSFTAFVAGYKTGMCEYRGHCTKKETCYFAHSDDEMRPGFCLRYFNTGKCQYDNCRFEHNMIFPEVPLWLRQCYDNLRHKERRCRSRSSSPQRARNDSRRFSRSRSRSPPQPRVVDGQIIQLRQDLETTRAMIVVLQREMANLTSTNAGLINIVRCLVEKSVERHQQPQVQQTQVQQFKPDYISSLIATINKK